MSKHSYIDLPADVVIRMCEAKIAWCAENVLAEREWLVASVISEADQSLFRKLFRRGRLSREEAIEILKGDRGWKDGWSTPEWRFSRIVKRAEEVLAAAKSVAPSGVVHLSVADHETLRAWEGYE